MIAAMTLLGALLPLVAAAETPAAQGTNCEEFDATGFSICGEFLEFWNANGGLPVFGYPLTDAFEEKNPDTGQTYLVQYFERQRFELHPENAGTVYTVLFGRLGAQILDMQGRDWMSFPKASPDAAHYFEVTGHAIAPEFWAYWSSHGLELGDKGISFRESLMLFGYPISEPAMETNADGDTVLTQWFERAVFEFHPDNPAEHQVLLRRVGAELLEMMQPAFEFDVVAEGFDNPRHLDAGADGTLYVAEAGRGGEQCFTIPAEEEGEEDAQLCYGQTGGVTEVMSGESLADMWSAADPSGMFASGTHSVAVAPDGTIYAVVGEPFGIEGEPAGEFWHLVKVDADGSTTMVADLLAYEETNNPDGLEDAPPDQGGEPGIHSNPYGVVATDAGLFVVDAGGNSVLMVTYDGTITTYGVFPIVEVEAPEFLGAPPGTMIPMQPVPTSATVGPDGALYVGQLTGFPFPTGGASVFRLEDTNNDGDALDEGEMTVYADGLSAILDLEFGPDNNLYVVEMAREGLLALEMGDPNNPAPGSVVKIGPDGTQTVIASEGLIAPSGIEIMADGTIYVTNLGIMAGAGQVVELHATAAAE